MIGHILRHEGLVGTILENTVEGRKRKERQRLEYVKKILDDVGCSGYCNMKRVSKYERMESCIKLISGLLTITTTYSVVICIYIQL